MAILTLALFGALGVFFVGTTRFSMRGGMLMEKIVPGHNFAGEDSLDDSGLVPTYEGAATRMAARTERPQEGIKGMDETGILMSLTGDESRTHREKNDYENVDWIAIKTERINKKDRFYMSDENKTTETERPEINVDQSMFKVAEDAWKNLKEMGSLDDFYMMAGRCVELRYDRHGTPKLFDVKSSYFRMHCSKWTKWVREDGEGEKIEMNPPIDIINAMLADPERHLPELNRISRVPLFTKDGVLIDSVGFYVNEGIYLDLPVDQDCYEVSSIPSADEIENALAYIHRELLGDFPIKDKASMANLTAMIIQTFVREMIDGPTPPYLLTKPQPGSGATLLANLATIVATGGAVTPLTEGSSDDEMRKRITASLRALPPIVLFDNISRRIDYASFASAITSEFWSDRMLCHSTISEMPVRCTWMLTGNNVDFSVEMKRRMTLISLDANVENPSTRVPEGGWRHKNISLWAKENRPVLVWSCLTLIQNWIAQGSPAGSKTKASFESWAEVMSGILECAGIEGFLENDSDLEVAIDPEHLAVRALILALEAKYGDRTWGVTEAFCMIESGGHDLNLGRADEGAKRQRLGYKLRKVIDHVFGDFKLIRAPKAGGTARYCLVLANPDAQLATEETEEIQEVEDTEAELMSEEVEETEETEETEEIEEIEEIEEV